MPGSYSIALWVIGVLAELYVVVCSLVKKNFIRDLSINIYMLALVGMEVGAAVCISRFGISSNAYAYYYYYTDSLSTILIFWVIIHFYREVFKELHANRYVRRAAVLLLIATAFFSFLVVHQAQDHLTSRFIHEIGRNLYFVGLVLTYLLWGTLLKLRETRMRLVQLVLALGVYFSATAGTYAIGNLFPGLYMPVLRYLFPILGVWLPAAWAYTFTKIPDDARLAAGSLLARAR
jgi:hypothetical protein